SVDSNKGDTFTATVTTGSEGSYGDLPSGTKVTGHVAAVHPKKGDQPAVLDLAFDRLVFPNGRKARIDGTLTSLDGPYVTTNSNGTLVAKNADNKDQRMVYAGYGAGGGLLVGVFEKKPLEGAILGGVLGYIFGQVQHDQKKPSDITLKPGTAMGVRI